MDHSERTHKTEIIKSIAREFNLKLVECDLVMLKEEQDALKLKLIEERKNKIYREINQALLSIRSAQGKTHHVKDHYMKDAYERLYKLNELVYNLDDETYTPSNRCK